MKAVCISSGHRYYRWSYQAQDTYFAQCTAYQAAKRESYPFIRCPSTHMDGYGVNQDLRLKILAPCRCIAHPAERS